jgi:hypothetical protein
MRRGKVFDGVWNGVVFDEELRSVQSPTHFKMMDLLKKFDKNYNATGKQLRQGWSGPHA